MKVVTGESTKSLCLQTIRHIGHFVIQGRLLWIGTHWRRHDQPVFAPFLIPNLPKADSERITRLSSWENLLWRPSFASTSTQLLLHISLNISIGTNLIVAASFESCIIKSCLLNQSFKRSILECLQNQPVGINESIYQNGQTEARLIQGMYDKPALPAASSSLI